MLDGLRLLVRYIRAVRLRRRGRHEEALVLVERTLERFTRPRRTRFATPLVSFAGELQRLCRQLHRPHLERKWLRRILDTYENDPRRDPARPEHPLARRWASALRHRLRQLGEPEARGRLLH